jgi:hypothetical protein
VKTGRPAESPAQHTLQRLHEKPSSHLRVRQSNKLPPQGRHFLLQSLLESGHGNMSRVLRDPLSPRPLAPPVWLASLPKVKPARSTSVCRHLPQWGPYKPPIASYRLSLHIGKLGFITGHLLPQHLPEPLSLRARSGFGDVRKHHLPHSHATKPHYPQWTPAERPGGQPSGWSTRHQGPELFRGVWPLAHPSDPLEGLQLLLQSPSLHLGFCSSPFGLLLEKRGTDVTTGRWRDKSAQRIVMTAASRSVRSPARSPESPAAP